MIARYAAETNVVTPSPYVVAAEARTKRSGSSRRLAPLPAGVYHNPIVLEISNTFGHGACRHWLVDKQARMRSREQLAGT